MDPHAADQRLFELARERSPAAAVEVVRNRGHVELIVNHRTECAAWSSRCDAGKLIVDIVASRQRLAQTKGRSVSHERGHHEEVEAHESAMVASSKLQRDRSIRFQRAVAGEGGLVHVDVEIESNLDVHIIATLRNKRGELHGGYFEGQVYWADDQPATGLLCATARELLARDIEDALAIFKTGLLLATQWTSYGFAAKELEDYCMLKA